MPVDNIVTLLVCAAILFVFLIRDGIVLFGGLVVLLAAIFTSSGSAFFETLGTLQPRSWTEFVVVISIAFAIIVPVNYLVMYLVKADKPDETSQEIARSGTTAFLLLAVPTLLAAVLEEIVFRGFLLTRLSDVFGTNNFAIVFTVGITSLIFGLGHYYQTGIQSALVIGFFSIVIGVIFIKTDFNLGYAIAIHLLNNLAYVVAHRLRG